MSTNAANVHVRPYTVISALITSHDVNFDFGKITMTFQDREQIGAGLRENRNTAPRHKSERIRT